MWEYTGQQPAQSQTGALHPNYLVTLTKLRVFKCIHQPEEVKVELLIKTGYKTWFSIRKLHTLNIHRASFKGGGGVTPLPLDCFHSL